MTASSEILTEYESLANRQGFFVDRDSVALRLSGSDRKTFLHNFCTADIKALEAGQSTEAFILNGKGKTLFFVQVLCTDEHLMLIVPDSQKDDLNAHLSRYVIVEDVTIDFPADTLIVYTSWETESGFVSHIGQHSQVAVVGLDEANALLEGERTAVSRETFEAIRIESRFPLCGVDVTDDCLAQEFERDATAISYTKGCYLGQETVARLDALGHTNRSFCLAKADSEKTPDLGSELTVEEKKCGKATSTCWSPKYQSYVVLAMVKKPNHEPGKLLQLGDQQLTVLPQES